MFWHQMTWQTNGISLTAPPRWRSLNGIVAAYWQAESQPDANAYYVAEDPRIMVFLNDVSENISFSHRNGQPGGHNQSMMRVMYVPAGVPLWTRSHGLHRFSHLNLHIHKDRLLKFITPSLGGSKALSALGKVAQLDDPAIAEALPRLLIGEILDPARSAAFAESLVGGIFTGTMQLSDPDEAPAYLTPRQIARIGAAFTERRCRMTVAEMAAVVGLSESWFSRVFRKETGLTPAQWQAEHRVEIARTLLRDTDLPLLTIAYHCGFADQAHFTNVFGKRVGLPPAAWRKSSNPPA